MRVSPGGWRVKKWQLQLEQWKSARYIFYTMFVVLSPFNALLYVRVYVNALSYRSVGHVMSGICLPGGATIVPGIGQ